MSNDSMTTLIGRGGAVFLEIDEMEEILSTGPAVIYVAEVTGDYAAKYISPNVEAQMGYKPSDFTDDASFWASHIHPEDAPRIFEGLQNLFGHDHHTHEYRFRMTDGSYLWVHDELKLIRDPSGGPVKIIGYWTVIAERKETEEALRRSEVSLANAQRIARPGNLDRGLLPNGWTVLTRI